MNRKTLTAVASFAILGLLALFALRQPEKGESSTDRQRPITKIDPAALDTITVARNGITSTLKREGGKYRVTTPIAASADDAAVKAAFDALEKLELGNLVSENKAKQAEFQVDDAKALHVVAKNEKANQILVDLRVGKAVGKGTMVRLAGQDQIWEAVGPLRSAFDKSPADWRDRSVTSFTEADAESITVKAADGSAVTLKKNGKAKGSENKWEVVTANPKIEKLDDTVPNSLVSTLASFKTNDFADGAAPATTGLDAPELTVTVEVKGGKKITLLVGKKKAADEVYVKTADSPQVYVVKSYNADRIAKRPIDFRDKTLADVGEADLSEVAVTHGADSYTIVHEGTAWKAKKPAKIELNTAPTSSISGAFKDWKATSFAEDTSPATTGLAKPTAIIAIKSRKGATMTFKVGNETKDKQSVYLQSSQGPDVYLAPKWSTDRVLVKLDTLKKK